jgi:hypothetical protein
MMVESAGAGSDGVDCRPSCRRPGYETSGANLPENSFSTTTGQRGGRLPPRQDAKIGASMATALRYRPGTTAGGGRDDRVDMKASK